MLDFWTAKNADSLAPSRLAGIPKRVTVYYATETDCPTCGWDEFTQSAKKTDCTTCDGVGKVITWKTQVIRASVVWTSADLRYLAPTPGIELGDVTIGIARVDKDVFDEVMANERGYLVVDGKTVKPMTIAPSVVPGIIEEGYLVNCNLATPETTA